ncbi:hypothetical protein KSD_90900 [Ktedonobacter sp. SOSP1-85]|uniref:hypothetical protein n=1 Tax=Ktedonobacter sp. SOSP1-85 TaxID=2778367 RepID=UPI001915F676|nr:hypothetical protein [Ktedonobacter sp. SOSP1-85]GHO81319.1 hypothetical protein KSD_90900 [Ktedonobacter sp. SOSP1-85]
MKDRQSTRDIRSLVTNYTVMPGLILATIGGFLAFLGAFSILWNKWLYYMWFGNNQDSPLTTLALIATMFLPLVLYLVVIFAVIRYYKNHFGQVKPQDQVKKWLTWELIAAFVLYFFVGTPLDYRLHSPVSFTLLIFALFLVVHWWLFAKAQAHYLILAAIAVVLSFVPMFNSVVYNWLYVKYTSPDWYGFNIGVCSGLLLLIAGLLDHWHMVRAFARVRSQILAGVSATPIVGDPQTGME